MNWQRATTDEKKTQRKDAIYKAALCLYQKKGYESISFNAIAVQAGFTKSNMYRYFSSKEEIFLSIFARLFEDWFVDCSEQLKRLEVNVEVEEFAEVWVVTQLSHKQFLDLTPLLFLSLESNSSYEQLVEFKTLSMDLLYKLSLEVSRVYPEIEKEKVFSFLTLNFAATANYWAAESKQNEVLNKIYQLEQFKVLKPNFEKSLRASVEIIIRGIQAR